MNPSSKLTITTIIALAFFLCTESYKTFHMPKLNLRSPSKSSLRLLFQKPIFSKNTSYLRKSLFIFSRDYIVCSDCSILHTNYYVNAKTKQTFILFLQSHHYFCIFSCLFSVLQCLFLAFQPH